MEEFPICFSSKSLIGVLYIKDLKPKFIREQFTKKSPIYIRINEMSQFGFDYSYINNILVIEDNAVKRHDNFNCMLEDLYLSTKGDFILFFSVERKNNIWLASSLTLPDIYYLKNNLKARSLNIII